ncbi:MAG: YihY family inner membrane protein [Burkholderiales bacterium]|jgi:membrane protein|nr:YihY family inner membrane protein [Burkholderiales bacterium]
MTLKDAIRSDAFWQRYRILDFSRFIVRRMLDLRMTRVAASLTFTTLLAIVPFLTIALVVVSAFPVFAEFSARFQTFIFGTLVPEYAAKAGEYINSFINNVGNLTAPGLIILAVAALLLLNTIEDAFNDIWSVRRSRRKLHRLLVYWMILTLGPLLIGVGFTVWHSLRSQFGGEEELLLLAHLFQYASSLVLTTFCLWLIYRFVPNRYVYAQHALTGALIAAVFIEAARAAFSWYVGQVASYQLIYGAFASLPVFLLWLYCLWLIVLAGAIIAASMSYWRGAAWRRSADMRRNFQDAVEILLLLYSAQLEGKSLTVNQIRREVSAADGQLHYLLDMMARKDFVQEGGSDNGERWVLKKNGGTLKIAEVMCIFLDEKTFDQRREIEVELRKLLQPLFESLDISLERLARNIAARKGAS